MSWSTTRRSAGPLPLRHVATGLRRRSRRGARSVRDERLRRLADGHTLTALAATVRSPSDCERVERGRIAHQYEPGGPCVPIVKSRPQRAHTDARGRAEGRRDPGERGVPRMGRYGHGWTRRPSGRRRSGKRPVGGGDPGRRANWRVFSRRASGPLVGPGRRATHRTSHESRWGCFQRCRGWVEVQRGALRLGWVALDTGLELAEEPVEVGDRPRVHLRQVEWLTFPGVGNQVYDRGRGRVADRVGRGTAGAVE